VPVRTMQLLSIPPIQMWDFSTYQNLLKTGYETASRHLSDWEKTG